ncbi:unnamed protein product [Lupinus luteus]|uniref:Uncharacterized protein n=1 Tax=Lupinus luteus TaxID=3873 RepID=A0AAV1XP55_LUPLU
MNSDSENDISEGEVAWPEAMSGWGDGSSREEDGDDVEAFPSRPSVPLQCVRFSKKVDMRVQIEGGVNIPTLEKVADTK